MEILNQESGFILGMEFHGILCQIEKGEKFTNKLFHTKNIDVETALRYCGYSFKIEKLCDTWSLIVFGEKLLSLAGDARQNTTI